MKTGPKPTNAAKAKAVDLSQYRRARAGIGGPSADARIPEPPVHIGGYALEEWARVCRELYLAGILDHTDTGALAAYCQAYDVWRSASEEITRIRKIKGDIGAFLTVTASRNVIQNPLLGVMNKSRGDMVRLAAELGMTPSSRASLKHVPRS